MVIFVNDVVLFSQARVNPLLIDDARQGLADIAAGKVKDARAALSAIKRRRAK